MSANDIVLIYADQNRKDIGVLQDYYFDMCYGDKENNFQCKLQGYNPAMSGKEKITDDYILYIEFTEYGGVIDKIEINSKTNEITLSGRSWHGFLNSFVIEPAKGFSHRTYSGEANAVIAQIIRDIGMTSWFTVENVDSGITIPSTVIRYQKAYDCIMSMLLANDAKLIMWYQNSDDTVGKVHLRAVSRVNTGVFEDFDTSQTPFKAGTSYNNVNELICLGQGNGANRAVIHLYANENGQVLPYCRKDAKQDSDYYTDLDALSHSTDPEDTANYAIINAERITGAKRYTEVYDYPNAEIIENYLKLTQRPNDWPSSYTKYYYLDLTKTGNPYTLFEQEYYDDYDLINNEPADWSTHYKDYYVRETFGGVIKQVENLPDSQAHVSYRPNIAEDGYDGLQTIDLNEWNNYFETENASKSSEYYEKVPQMSTYVYQKAEAVTVEEYKYYESNDPPFDWQTNYGSYYMEYETGSGKAYTPVTGDQVTSFELLTTQPTDWGSNYGSYYFKEKDIQHTTPSGKVIIEIGDYLTVTQGIDDGLIDDFYIVGDVIYDFPEWLPNSFYAQVTKTVPPAYTHTREAPGGGGTYTLPFYKVTKKVAPTFTPGKYYYKYVSVIPEFRTQYEELEPDPLNPGGWIVTGSFGGYYKQKTVERIPTFELQDVYYKVEDRYSVLCSAGEEKLKGMSNKDSLEISLALESHYDIGDIVGSKDMATGINTIKQILRKIIKIKKGILSIDYEVD